MRDIMRFIRMALASLVALLALPGRADERLPEVEMQLLSSGAAMKIGFYRPQHLILTPEKPKELKTSPALASPLYGSLRFGGKSFLVVLDEPDGKDASLYIDANGNGDLSDDPATSWEKRNYPGADGGQLTQYNGSFKLPFL